MRRSVDYVNRLKEYNAQQVRELLARGLMNSPDDPASAVWLNGMINTMGVKAEPQTMQEVSRVALRGAVAPERTKNVGVGIRYGPEGVFRSQMPIESMYEPGDGFNQGSPLTLRYAGEGYLMTCEGLEDFVMPVSLVEGPSWYPSTISDSGGRVYTLSQLVQRELGVLMIGIPDESGYQGCDYRAGGKACLFCGYTLQKSPLTPELLCGIVEKDLGENDTSITMTGGSNDEKDTGLSKYKPFVAALRKRFGASLPLQIEVSPSRERADLDWIVENKLSAWMNLEIFPSDEQTRKLRRLVLPNAKGEMDLEVYMDSFEYLNRQGIETYCVLIAGIQPRAAIVEGATRLGRIGTTVSVLPFKPNKDSAWEDRMPCAVDEFVQASRDVDQVMQGYGVDLGNRSPYWCSGCGGCGADRNIAFNRESIGSGGLDGYRERPE